MSETREQRFTRLFADAYRPLWSYARRRVPLDAIDDVVAETLTIAWRKLDAIPGEPATLPYLYGVAYRVIGNSLRAHRRHLRLLERVHAEPPPAPEAVEPNDAVLDALATLRAEDQEVLRLSEWEGLAASEIATVLGCSANAAALRLSRARARFKVALTGSAPSRTSHRRKEIDV